MKHNYNAIHTMLKEVKDNERAWKKSKIKAIMSGDKEEIEKWTEIVEQTDRLVNRAYVVLKRANKLKG